jgi:predicted DCC family thiol-disulfide oxidoreductase YuxK
MICAAADGPIPIGDIFGAVIAAGGTIWTAWDIYDVSYIMPKKLSDELYNGIAQMKTTLLAETRRIAEELVKQSQENGSQLSQSAMAQL